MKDLSLTYPGRGGTLTREPPDGFRVVEHRITVGTGLEVLNRAADGLFSWKMHERSGVRALSANGSATVGSDVLLTVGRPPLAVRAPCRVIYRVDDEHRRGFAYGTLEGHPESGEECFMLSMDSSDVVHFEIYAFSRPATWLSRLGGPVARGVQNYLTQRYLRAITTF